MFLLIAFLFFQLHEYDLYYIFYTLWRFKFLLSQLSVLLLLLLLLDLNLLVSTDYYTQRQERNYVKTWARAGSKQPLRDCTNKIMFIYLTLKISIIIIINFHILVITHYTVTPISESSIIFFNPHKLIFYYQIVRKFWFIHLQNKKEKWAFSHQKKKESDLLIILLVVRVHKLKSYTTIQC